MRTKGLLFLFFIIINNNLSSGQLLNVLNKATHTVGHVISDVVSPVEKLVVGATLKNCNVVKALFETPVNLISGSLLEPDPSKLSLDLHNQHTKIDNINIRRASHELLKSPHFDTNKPVVIFLHGFLQNSDSAAPKTITKAILSQWDVNVLVVDSSSVLSIIYTKAPTCIQFIGKELGEMLATLTKKGRINPANIHIVGHGLGAHIAGFSGKTFHDLTGHKIAHITGLDPAGPCFFQEKSDFKLKHTDAQFVDVIHTDSGVFGLGDPIGHADFYPNLGEKQPGCVLPPCSHIRAWELYSDSVNSLFGYPAVKCISKDAYVSGSCDHHEQAFMGFATDRHTRGTFYLKTSASPPFGLGTDIKGIDARKGILNLF